MSRPLDFFSYRAGALETGGVPLSRIAERVGTPAYVYSADAFLAPLRELQRGLAGIDHLICFAVKSNSNIAILKMLSDAGAGMDLVSGGELYRAGRAGVPGERVVFSGVGKTSDEMLAALRYRGKGIYSFNVESVPELFALSKAARRAGRRARVALRFNPDVDPKTHPYISTGLKKNKFGLNRAEVLEVARRYDKLPGIDLAGISIHIGSQLLSLSPLADAFEKLRGLLVELDRLLPRPISFLDLGGGVGITYKNEKTIPIRRYCELIRRSFGTRYKILLEPGRVLSGNSGVLLTKVLYRKERPRKDFVIVDAAMNDLIRPALYGSFHEIVPVRKSRGKARLTDVVGPVCESADCFGADRKLPPVEPGELLAVLSSGAYGFVMASQYNSRPRPPEVLVRNGRIQIIRERETLEDLVERESI